MIRTVHLHGDLRERYGTSVQISAETPYLLARGLCHRFKGLEKTLREGNWIVCRKRVEPAQSLDERDVHRPLNDDDLDIHLMPEVMGAGATFKIIIGVVLIVVGAVISFMGGSGVPIMLIGLGLVMSGIAQLMAPSPNTSASKSGVAPNQSFMFGGATNVASQGVAVPIVYGELIVGTVVISTGIEDAQINVSTGLPIDSSIVTAGETASR